MAANALDESALRVSNCVTGLLRKQPFFGSLVLRLPLRADPTRKTLASDGHEIRYSPDWVAETDAHLIETAMARVIMACALKHHTRRGERDPERWQTASQLVTHALLRDAGFTLPPEAEAWEDLSVEQASTGCQSPGTMISAMTATLPKTPAERAASRLPAVTATVRTRTTVTKRTSQGRAGASNAPLSHDPSGTGEVMDADARTGGGSDSGDAPVDVAAEEQAWHEAMHQALNIARAEGKAPGRVEETVRNAHASTLDWRTLPCRYMTDAASRDYSWNVPYRRFIDGGRPRAGQFRPRVRTG